MGEDFPIKRTFSPVYSASPYLVGVRIFSVKGGIVLLIISVYSGYGALFEILVEKDSRLGSVSFW